MKKKILLLSDDCRSSSGVATMSKEIIYGTSHKYDWVQLGASVDSSDHGKIIDISEDVKTVTGVLDANVKIISNKDYGDIIILRKIINDEKPDAILFFTDPHYWEWLYDTEHEIRQKVPLLFYHVWDDLPDPKYNRNYYESCDWIGCISKQTYGIVKRVGKSKDVNTFNPLEDHQISYVPHGVNPDVFYPKKEIDSNISNVVLNNQEFDFVLFFNNRNIRRKQPSDVMYSFKLFCNQLPREKSKRCLLIMKTNTVDVNGTDLIAVADALCPECNIHFVDMKISQSELNELYNIADCTINISNNEGFGIATTESIMAGTPIIVNVTGGLQDQCGFNINGVEISSEDYVSIGSLHNKKLWGTTSHGEWSFPVWSVSHTLNGSPPTPYIFDDRINDEDVADAIMEVYKIGKEKRKEIGLKGREWAINHLSSKVMCDKMEEGIDSAILNYQKRKKYELYKII